MSEALYRKYRPQTFDDVVGQTHIERTLKNAIESDKVSHAYLFCGPRGTGKTTTARLLAKALLCDGGPTPSPDGTCEQCLAIAEGTHPDVNEMDAASRTGVENVREEIIGRVQYAPTRGRYKVYIIDEVHMLSPAAFNALLKTLEEPPSHVVFILCTTDPQKVPETIHSRCQRFDFHRLSNEEIVSRLGAVCMAEGVQFEGDALDLVAHRAQGGMRDALTTLEQLIAFGNGAVTVEVARNVLGSLDTDDMTAIVEAIAARDAAACFVWVSEYIETGADLAQFTRDLAAYVRDLYILELTDGAVAVDAPASSRAAMADEARRFGSDRLAYILRVLGDLNTELRSSTNARLSFEIALTRMVRPESDLTLESLAARIESLEARLAAGSSAAVQGASAAAPSVAARESVAPAPSGRVPASQCESESPARPSASIPPSSTGYKPLVREPERIAPSPEAATAAMDKAAAFRAQVAQRRAEAQMRSFGGGDGSHDVAAQGAAFPASPIAPTTSAVPSGAPSASAPASSVQNGSAAGESVSDGVRAKLLNPAALQRGWQATLADLKRQRAVYAALMQSARVVADPGGEGVAVEFSKENDFAYSAAQKPDVSAALASALQQAFGEPVPFKFTQGGGVAAAVVATRSMGAPKPVADASTPRPAAHVGGRSAEPPFPPANAPASSRGPGLDVGASSVAGGFAPPATASQTPPWEGSGRFDAPAPESDDVVPYSDADVSSYLEDGGYDDGSYGGDSHVDGASLGAAGRGGSDAGQVRQEEPPFDGAGASYTLDVAGPAPVDPYLVGKELGFDSMPPAKKRPKGTVAAKGWPGVGDAGASTASTGRLDGGSAASDGAKNAPRDASREPACDRPDSTRPDAAHSDGLDGANSFVPFDPATAVDPSKPNPFAGRKMPSGIGGGGGASPFPEARPAQATEGGMGIADIFGAFGVSMDDVKEE